MRTWQDTTEPGTVDAGYADMNTRLIHAWIAKGLLDQPRLRTLRRVSANAEHNVNQRRLLLLLLGKRRQVSS
ncbi:hypothetical protein [Streptomyces cadmiisoli]|uniref:hypothetical protein n=1 Tax=Streptomyces cadmiisoli TaxID=2184053 RepID=UPI003661FE84